MKVFLTGIKGFIGSTFVKTANDSGYLWEGTDKNLWDIRQPWPSETFETDYFLHFAANVAARQSIDHPTDFVLDNIVGTHNVLELARKVKPKLFVYISSAEALGGCEEGYLDENAPMRPSNPYAASKGAGELLTYAYFRSYGLPAIIVRTQCVWSMDQTDPTKAVPIIKKTILDGKPVKIYTRNGVSGSRQWIDVKDFCARLLNLLPHAVPGETYHIVGPELDNFRMAQLLADKLDMPLAWENQEISPTHEWRYALKDKS